MHRDDIARVYNEFIEPSFGTLMVDELVHVDALIAEQRPRSFVEVGTASGLSGGLIARMLDEYGGDRLLTIDRSETMFNDPTRETGFCLPSVYTGERVAVERRVNVTAIDLLDHDERFDLAFVDAGHVHPWPLLDTLCVGAVLDGHRTVLNHDLRLFHRRPDGRAVGPKHLFDQFPESHRRRYDAYEGNLFTVSLDMPTEQLVDIAIDALFLPWTLRLRLPDELVDRLADAFGEHYSPRLRDAFLQASATFNKPNARYFRLDDAKQSGAKQGGAKQGT